MGIFKDVAERIFDNARIVMNPTPMELREMSREDEVTTEFGSPNYVTRVRHRSARFTEVVEGEADERQRETVREVEEYLKGRELICVDRTMGQNPKYRFKCRMIITRDYARIPFMWQNLLFPAPEDEASPDLTVINVPEWKERDILVGPESSVTFILGSDYTGELKKAHLRMAMYRMKIGGGLGLHAGSKVIRVRDKEGTLIEKGFILFGLSGTGKTTLTVHNHGLKGEEGVVVRQDDVVLIDKKGYCYGTENGFYIKTEGLDERQEVLYSAATRPDTIFENVYVDDRGRVDFSNYTLTSNGRAVVRRADVKQCDSSIDLPKANVVIFITRRDNIVPPICKLFPEQAAAFFMLGESIETSAGDPSRAGHSIHVVGDNPFIVGPLYEEGNRFLEILRANLDMESYILNTGKVGGRDKITIEDSVKIMEEIARGRISWRYDPDWGYLIPDDIEGIECQKLNPANYYERKEYEELIKRLRQERKEWLERFPRLEPEILESIHL